MIKNNKLVGLCFIVFSILCSLVIFFVFNIRFSEPDDYLFASIFGGAYGTGKNLFYEPFISFLLGKILNSLSLTFHIFNIYGLFLLLMMCMEFSAMHVVAMKLNHNLLAHIMVVGFQVLVSFCFTFTVFAYLLVGTMIIWACVVDQKEGRTSLWEKIFFGILAAFGVMLRTGVVMTTMLLLLPIIGISIYKKRTGNCLKFLIGVALLTVIISRANVWYCNGDPVLKEYQSWNEASANIRDYPAISTDKYKDMIASVGWSDNDVALVSSWTFADKTAFNTKSMEKYVSNISMMDRYNFNILLILQSMLKEKVVLAYLSIAVILFILDWKWKGWPNLLLQLILYGLPLALMAALFFRQRYVERVAIPFLILGVMQILLYSDSSVRRQKKVRKNLSFIVLIPLLITIVMAGNLYTQKQNANSSEKLDNYLSQNEDTLHLINSRSANSLVINIPVKELKKESFYTNILKLGSWDSFSTRFYSIANQYQIENADELFQALIKDHTLLITSQENDCIRIKQYLLEHYQINAEYKVKKKISDEIKVYQWTKK